MLYRLAFTFQIGAVIARFLLFNKFISQSSINMVIYSEFTYYTAVLPLLTLGIIFSHNATFPRFTKEDNKSLEVQFYKIFVIFISAISIGCLLIDSSTDSISTLSISMVVVSFNVVSFQIRSLFLNISNILYAMEIGIIILIYFFIGEDLFLIYLSFYYGLNLMVFILFLIYFEDLKMNIRFAKRFCVKNMKILLIGFPTYAKDFIDVIILGIFASNADKEVYALVILLTAPSKVAYGLLYQVLQKYLADANMYFSELKFQSGIFRKLAISVIFVLVAIILGYSLGHNMDLHLMTIILFRCLGLIYGADLRANFLDMLHQTQEITISLTYLSRWIVIFIILAITYMLTESLIVMSLYPLIISVLYILQINKGSGA